MCRCMEVGECIDNFFILEVRKIWGNKYLGGVLWSYLYKKVLNKWHIRHGNSTSRVGPNLERKLTIIKIFSIWIAFFSNLIWSISSRKQGGSVQWILALNGFPWIFTNFVLLSHFCKNNSIRRICRMNNFKAFSILILNRNFWGTSGWKFFISNFYQAFSMIICKNCECCKRQQLFDLNFFFFVTSGKVWYKNLRYAFIDGFALNPIKFWLNPIFRSWWVSRHSRVKF